VVFTPKGAFMINWTLNIIPIKDVKEFDKNPRYISKDHFTRLESLIKKFGLIDKPILNKDFTIIGGHQRIKALKKMKAKTVECWLPDRPLDEKEIEELCIGLNLNQGQWDFDILANNYDVLDLLGYGFSEDLLMGHMKDAEEMLEEQKEKTGNKKKKCCPNCGCEF
jgi:hypothetical protein